VTLRALELLGEELCLGPADPGEQTTEDHVDLAGLQLVRDLECLFQAHCGDTALDVAQRVKRFAHCSVAHAGHAVHLAVDGDLIEADKH
jgi:hypothetical protein